MNSNCYEILGIKENANEEEIEKAYDNAVENLSAEISASGKHAGDYEYFQKKMQELYDARENALENLNNLGHGNGSEGKKSGNKGKISSTGAKKVAKAVGVVALIGLLGFGGYKLITRNTGAAVTSGDPSTSVTTDVEEDENITLYDTSDGADVSTTDGSNGNGDTSESLDEEEAEVDMSASFDYGDIYDDELVEERAIELVSQLNEMGITNLSTGTSYTVDEIVTLIKYANGVYTPSTLEEIDVLHLNLLNLFIAPLNTDSYLYHVVYASGNDEFYDLALEGVNNNSKIDFAKAFAEYGQNGVYPLIEWLQEKREAIYSTMDRDEINSIYVEVGQVLADIMKGNGCTITVYEDKQATTYTFTSEEILANHSSALLLTTEMQLIFANHYEIRDENDNVIDAVQDTWYVTNNLNRDNGELVQDEVSMDEMNAWINNGCDDEWGIDDVLIDGQTFGQRVQSDMEGMAQNNYAMESNSLTK